MKNFTCLITICFTFLYHSLYAQWTAQVTVLPAPMTASIAIAVLDSNIVWTLSVDLTNFSPAGDPIGPINRFTRTVNGGSLWVQDTIEGAAGLHPGGITAVDGQTAWVTMQDESLTTSGGIFKTTNGGANWIRQNTAFSGLGGKPMFIYFFDPDTGLVVGERNPGLWEIYTTSNGGAQWDTIPQANIPPKLSGEWLREGFEYSVFHNTFWFCTSGPTARVFKSTNRGRNWTAVIPGSGYDMIHSVAFQNDSIGLACAFKGIHSTIIKTTNGGESWFTANTPQVPTPHIISYVPGTSGSYVVVGHLTEGNNTGTAITVNGGSSWTMVDQNSYGLLSFVAPNVGWAVGSNNVGSFSIFRWSGKTLGILFQNENGESNHEINLDQNCPNPFNLSTKIKYQITTEQNISLTVYDILGNEVSTLVDEKKQAGHYEVEFSAFNLPKGIYLYKLRAGNYSEIKEMMLLK